jgi:hypothetical protein
VISHGMVLDVSDITRMALDVSDITRYGVRC